MKKKGGRGLPILIWPAIYAILALALFGCTDEESFFAIGPDDDPGPMADTMFYTDVKTIIDLNCATIDCHSGATPETGLNMESYDQILEGSDNSVVVVSGNPQLSLMYRTLVDINPRMPVDANLPQPEIDSLRQWVEDGLYNQR